MTTMVSFRVEDEDVAAADRWAKKLGVERSELLRDALAAHLARLAAEADAESYAAAPLTDTELTFVRAEDWGPAEEWSDWSDWAADNGNDAAR